MKLRIAKKINKKWCSGKKYSGLYIPREQTFLAAQRTLRKTGTPEILWQYGVDHEKWRRWPAKNK